MCWFLLICWNIANQKSLCFSYIFWMLYYLQSLELTALQWYINVYLGHHLASQMHIIWIAANAVGLVMIEYDVEGYNINDQVSHFSEYHFWLIKQFYSSASQRTSSVHIFQVSINTIWICILQHTKSYCISFDLVTWIVGISNNRVFHVRTHVIL